MADQARPTAVTPPALALSLRQLAPPWIAVAALAAIAWAVTLLLAHSMGNGPGTMGLGLLPFLGLWVVMMAAMMLPSVAPVAVLWARLITGATAGLGRVRRMSLFLAGYLLAWVAFGAVAFGALDGAGRLLLRSDVHDQRVNVRSRMPPFPAAALDLVKQARARLASPTLQLESAHVALRALTADGLPAVGWLPRSEGVYVAVTHSGVTLAPLLGELVSGEVNSGEDDEQLRTFRPDRFQTLELAAAPHHAQPQEGGQ